MMNDMRELMVHSTTDIDSQLAEEANFDEPELEATNHNDRLFTAAWLFQCLDRIYNLAAILGGLPEALRLIWANYDPQVVFGEEGVIMPPSALTFIINALLAFVEIKSQGQPGFPFQTHPHTIMVSITGLLIYGLASAVELVVSSLGLDHTSVYAIIARLGRISALCILTASLASLFYF